MAHEYGIGTLPEERTSMVRDSGRASAELGRQGDPQRHEGMAGSQEGPCSLLRVLHLHRDFRYPQLLHGHRWSSKCNG